MTRLDDRPKAGGLRVPYMVQEKNEPIDFKRVNDAHVRRCASERRCGVCGGKIPLGRIVFIGPDDGRRCFADPWMHEHCARLAMAQCPFLASRRGWREHGDNPFLARYEHNMAAFVARDGRAHREGGAWHFEALGELQPLSMEAC